MDKHKLATEELAHWHKTPAKKIQIVINFLKFSSDETLQDFKVNDMYQNIMLLQRIIDKDEMTKKVHNKIETLQKEIKEIYALFKPLFEKGLPYISGMLRIGY